MRAHSRQVLSVLATTASLIALTGCGGDGGTDTTEAAAGTTPAASASSTQSGDEAAIIAVATEVLTSTGGARVCDELLTTGFVSAAFGDSETCKKSDDDDPAEGAKVTDVSINGDTATATVTDVGGAAPGASGTWRFSRQAGKWRVSEWSIDYIRSGISNLFGSNYEPDGDDDPFADAKLRKCFVTELQARDDQELRSLFYAVLQERTEELEKPMLKCLTSTASAAQAPDRRLFELASREQLAEFLTPKQVDCVIERLRKTVTDKDIRQAPTSDEAALKIYQASEAAALQCGAGKGKASKAATAVRPKGKPARAGR
jgi:hypothetical protein